MGQLWPAEAELPPFDGIFDRVRAHLKHLGASCSLRKGKPAAGGAIRRAEAQMGLCLPEQLRDIYLRYGDGFLFRWDHGDDWGRLHFPSLQALVEQYTEWKTGVFWMDDCSFPHVTEPVLARNTYTGMKSWIPLVPEGNGDAFCVVPNRGNDSVVFHKHDWYDGGTGENGRMVAPDLRTFLAGWAGVCFTMPKGLLWPPTLSERGVEWTSKHFNEKYIVSD